MMTAWSSKPPLSIAREKRIDRTPRRLSHQKTPACVAEAIVNSRSFPGFTTAPTAPNTHPIRPMKKVAFQNRATLAWRKARSSSLFSLPNERPWLGIRRLLPARPLIARDRASIRARRHELSYVDGMGRPGLRSRDLRSFSRIRPVTATSFWSGRVDSNHRPLDPQGRIQKAIQAVTDRHRGVRFRDGLAGVWRQMRAVERELNRGLFITEARRRNRRPSVVSR